MAKKTISIGVEGNDGTGDNTRIAFQKVNDNFTELYGLYNPEGLLRFTDLADAPTSYEYNQILVASSTTSNKLTARTIVPIGNITVSNNDTQLILTVPNFSLSEDSNPVLNEPLNCIGNGIGNIPMPTTSVLAAYNSIHTPLTSLDSFVVPKLYIDQQVAAYDQISELRDVVVSSLSTGNLLSFNQGTAINLLTATVLSGIATLTFVDQGVVPFAIGSIILVSGVSPTTYNGIYTVTNCTRTSVSYTNSSTILGSGGTVRKQVWNNVASNNTTTRKFLRQTGTGIDSTAPTWDTIINADIPLSLTGKIYNGLTLTSSLTTGWKISGGSFPVEVSFIGGSEYSISGSNGTTITLPTSTGTVALNNQSFYIGTTSIAINRVSANLALTGISSVSFPGSSSGTAILQAAATAGTPTIALPTTTGTLALTTQEFYLGNTAIAINRTTGSIVLSGITSIDGYASGLAGGNSTTLLGSLPYQSNTNTTTMLSPNTTTTKKYLNQTGDGTNGAVPSWNQIDELGIITSGILSSGTGGIGYTSTGGGYIDQLTSKATTVILNKPTGLIYTYNDNLNAAATVSFTLTNSTISSTDLIIIQHVQGGTQFNYAVSAIAGSGSATVYLKNISAGNLAENLYLRFAVIKSVGAPP